MANGFDGSVTIDTSISTKGFNRGMQKIREAAVSALNAVLLPTLRVGNVIRATFTKVGGFVSSIFKKLLVGSLLFFAITASKIFASLREGLQDAIKLKGGDTEKRFESLKNTFTELKATIAAAFLPLVEIAIPYIQKALDWLIKLFNQLGMITAAFAGQKEVMQVVAGSAEKLAKQAEKEKKARQGALAAFDQINVLQKQQPDTNNLPQVETQMVPVTEDILTKVQKIKDEIAQWWNDPGGKAKEVWGKIIDWFKARWDDFKKFIFWDDWVAFFQGIWGKLTELWTNFVQWLKDGWQKFKDFIFLDDWVAFFQNTWETIKQGFADAWQVVSDVAITIWEQIKSVWSGVAPFFKVIWDTVVNIIQDRITFIKDVINSIKKILHGIVEYVAGVFTGDWGRAWEGIKSIFEGAFNGVKAFFKLVVNQIIDVINGLLRALTLGVNAISDALNSLNFTIPEWVPGFGGATFNLNIPQFDAPQIPKLATGAVIPPNSEFLAVLGDQRSGKNIEAPEGLIRQIISEEIGKVQAQITIGFTGNLASLVRELKPYIDKENVRVGGSLIRSGATTV